MLLRKRALSSPIYVPFILHTEDIQTYAYIHISYIAHTTILLFTKKEMHASYTVISMISDFAIKRFAM